MLLKIESVRLCRAATRRSSAVDRNNAISPAVFLYSFSYADCLCHLILAEGRISHVGPEITRLHGNVVFLHYPAHCPACIQGFDHGTDGLETGVTQFRNILERLLKVVSGIGVDVPR